MRSQRPSISSSGQRLVVFEVAAEGLYQGFVQGVDLPVAEGGKDGRRLAVAKLDHHWLSSSPLSLRDSSMRRSAISEPSISRALFLAVSSASIRRSWVRKMARIRSASERVRASDSD